MLKGHMKNVWLWLKDLTTQEEITTQGSTLAT